MYVLWEGTTDAVPKASWTPLNHNFLYLFSPKEKKKGTQLRISDFLVAHKDIKF